jgi:hypothetical protein
MQHSVMDFFNRVSCDLRIAIIRKIHISKAGKTSLVEKY